MRFEYLEHVTTQSWSDTCAMNEAESSINEIIHSFGRQHIDNITLYTIQTSVYCCNYDDALWCLMGSLDEKIEGNEPLLALLEKSWELLCHFQERRVLNIKETHRISSDCFVKGSYCESPIGRCLERAEQVAESSQRGKRSISDYRNNLHPSEWQRARPISTTIDQKKNRYKIKVE